MPEPAPVQTTAPERFDGLALFIPGILVNHGNASGVRSRHWRVEAGYRRTWRRRVWAFVLDQVRRAGHPAETWRRTQPKAVHLRAHTGGRMDRHGLAQALKPVLDGLVDARMLCDDAESHGHEVLEDQVIHRRDRGVWVWIRLRPGPDCPRRHKGDPRPMPHLLPDVARELTARQRARPPSGRTRGR